MPRLETMESFNHRMITKAKLQEPTGHTGGTVGMQSLIRRIEPMAAALFEHKDTWRGVQCFWFECWEKPSQVKEH